MYMTSYVALSWMTVKCVSDGSIASPLWSRWKHLLFDWMDHQKFLYSCHDLLWCHTAFTACEIQCGAQRMSPADLGDPLALPLQPPRGCICGSEWNVSITSRWIGRNINFHLRVNCNIFDDPWNFHLGSSSGQNFGFTMSTKYYSINTAVDSTDSC